MNLQRRNFLKASAAGLFIPSILNAQNRGEDKLRLAMIGVGGRGSSHVNQMSSQEFVAFCDVDEKRAASTYEKFPHVPRFKDFRVMFDKMGDQFDAVSIAVPDHMHYPIAMCALAHGKHVLCEKPLVRTFDEAMSLKQKARETGLITQMGNQGHANDGLREIEEWIDAGIIGKVSEVYHWTNRPIWPQGMASWPAAEPVPDTMAWDLWLGVAPPQAYSPEIAPFNWRGYWDYGCGAIGDMACHAMDGSYTPLRLGFPTRVSSEKVDCTEIAFPAASTIYFDFPATDKRGPIKLTWMDGGRRPRDLPFVPNEFILADPEKNKKGQANGTVILGDKGAIFSDIYSKRPRIFPVDYHRGLVQDGALPEKKLPRMEGGHFNEWIDSIKAGKQPGANIVEYAADFTGTALLGAISLKVDGPLDFDAQSLKFSNNQRANELLKSQYPYRKAFMVS